MLVASVDSFQTLMLRSGSEWVLWLLVALGVLAIAVSVERFVYFRRKRGQVRDLALALDSYLAQRDFESAISLVAPLPAVVARVVHAGIGCPGQKSAAIRHAMTSAFALERKGLEQRLNILSTLGTNAPFVGLLGTVIGIMMAFDELANSTSGGASNAVMAAIAEALVATAVGIAVALPCVAMFNFFQGQITAISDDVESISHFVLSHLSDDAGAVDEGGM